MTIPTHLIVSHGPFTSLHSFASMLDWLSAYIEDDEVTTYTDDRVLPAGDKLVEVLSAKLAAARHIRGERTA